jgi:hypothetical protein
MTRDRLVLLGVTVVVGLLITGIVLGASGGTEQSTQALAVADDATVFFPTSEMLVLSTATNATVAGRTDVPPGETVTVRIRSTDGPAPFVRQANTTVRENGTFSVTTDLSQVEANVTANVTLHHDGKRLAVRTVQLEHRPGMGSGATDSTTETAGTTVDVDGDGLTVAAAADEKISGVTDLTPGTELIVRVESTDSASPFLAQQPATVTDEGTFAASFDLGTAPAGTAITVTVRHDGDTVARTSGAVA